VFPFEDALDDLRNGVIVGLAAWQLDRFTRLVEHATYLQRTVRDLRGRVAWGAGEVDVTKAAGRFNVNVLSAVSQFESDLKSERLQLKNGQKAKDGEAHGGGWRPFGFNKDRVTHRAREAKLIRDAAERLIAGESVYSILADWHSKGIRTTPGGRWTTTAFRRLMCSPRVAGLRQHHDATYPAAWDPVLDESIWRQVRAVFADKDGRRHHGPPVKKLLVGMLVCSKCGATLITRLGGRPGNIRSYGCPPPKYGDGCGRTSIVAEPLEQYVRERALELLDTKEVCAAIMREEPTPATDPLYAERNKLLPRRDELEDMRSDPDIPLVRTDRDLAKIDSRLREIEAELQRRVPKRRPLMIPYGKTPEWVWATATSRFGGPCSAW
jgi:site-specific DNA recombinase